MASLSKDFYKRVWRTAFDRGKIELLYDSAKEAKRMRLRLYSGVQKFRQDITIDPDFSAILEQLEITEFKHGDQFGLCITRCILNPLNAIAAKQLNILMEPEANEMEESMKRLRESYAPPEDPYPDDSSS